MMLAFPCLVIMIRFYMLFKKKFSEGGMAPNLGYPADHPVSRYIRPKLSYWERFRIWVASLVHELLTDPTIDKEGLNFLDRVFRHEQT